ncbi:MAG: hypothetical protein CM1200mP10_13790 [Candidatus Neomarinimicrobiota bacterium]|nr:MAG: hypothetical protein CM1200mP10_13790 [Candidatus Neomarinimicrobiota bacterium]
MGVFLYSIWPLFKEIKFNPSNSQDTLDALWGAEKTILYREIQYIDAEYDIGNLDKDDYNLTRIELVQETSDIIAKIKLILSN